MMQTVPVLTTARASRPSVKLLQQHHSQYLLDLPGLLTMALWPRSKKIAEGERVTMRHVRPLERGLWYSTADQRRFMFIPVQEALVDITPSVTTVESTAAAKIFLETSYNALLSQSPSPRSMRRKNLEKTMSALGLTHEDRLRTRRQWYRTESDHLRQSRTLKASSLARHDAKGVSIAGYDVVRVLGKGSFGVVRLVTDGRAPKDVYAMKVIRKSEMLRNCQEGHLRAERDFLVASEGSRWVVPLIASFQDNTNLYLVMDYMIGGDFLGLLLREDVLEESVAK